MRFEIRDTFPVSPDALMASLLDGDIDARLASMAQGEREVLEDRQDGDVWLRRVRYSSGNPAFGQLARLIGSSTVSYEQILRIDHAARRVSWQMVPPAAGERLKAEGVWYVQPAAEGSERVVEGDVQVKIALVGGSLEGRIVEAIKKVYAKGTQYRKELLARGG